MVMRVATLSLVGKTRSTTQPRFLPAPWAEYPRRVPEKVTIPIRCEVRGQQIAGEVAVWKYSPQPESTRSERLLLIHGFRGDHHGMQLIVDGLPEFEVMVPDLPGYGQSPPLCAANGVAHEHTVDLYAAAVEGLSQALQLGSGDCLIGHSFGTIVCAAHCAQHNRDWSGVVLSAPISDNIFRGRLLPGAAVVELYYRLCQVLPEAAGDAVLRSPTVLEVMNLTLGVGWDRDLTAFVKDQHRQFFGGYWNRQNLLESYRASSRHTVKEYAPDVCVPTLLLAGSQDSLSTPEGRRVLRDSLPQGHLEIIRGSGHLVHYEKPAQLARAVRQFIGSLTSPGT
jgi:esterase